MKNKKIVYFLLIVFFISTIPVINSNQNSFEKSHLFYNVRISKVNVPDFLLLRYYSQVLPLHTNNDNIEYNTTSRNLENYSNFIFEKIKPDYLSSEEWENYKKTREDIKKKKLKDFYFIVYDQFIQDASEYPNIVNIKARVLVTKDGKPSIEDYDINSINIDYNSCCCKEIYKEHDKWCSLLGIVFTSNVENEEIFYDGLYLYHTFILDEIYFSDDLHNSTIVLNSKYQSKSIYDLFGKDDFYDNVDSLLKKSFEKYIIQKIDDNNEINYHIPKDNLTYDYYVLSIDYKEYNPLKDKIPINNFNEFSNYFDKKLNKLNDIRYLSWSSGGVVDHIDIILNDRTIFEIDKFDLAREEVFSNKKYYYYRTTNNYISNHILIGFIDNRYNDIDTILGEFKKNINDKNMRQLIGIRNKLIRINDFINECENIYPMELERGVIKYNEAEKKYLISQFDKNTKEKRDQINSLYNQITDNLELYSLEVAEESIKMGRDSLLIGRNSFYVGLIFGIIGLIVGLIGIIISYSTIKKTSECGKGTISIRRLFVDCFVTCFYRVRNWLWRNLWN